MKIIAMVDRTFYPWTQKDMEDAGYAWIEEEGYWQKEVSK